MSSGRWCEEKTYLSLVIGHFSFVIWKQKLLWLTASYPQIPQILRDEGSLELFTGTAGVPPATVRTSTTSRPPTSRDECYHPSRR